MTDILLGKILYTDVLLGEVFYKDLLAGRLIQDKARHTIFNYDAGYVAEGHPAISYSLPVTEEPYIYENGLHPFFDNLVAEGWLERAQRRALGRRVPSRFELLLTFGFDLAGAVSVIDTNPSELSSKMLDMDEPMDRAIQHSLASLSGVQPKLAVIEENRKYRPTHARELSTHIAKCFSQQHSGLIENEYLTTLAFRKLLPKDDIVEVKIAKVLDVGKVLLVKRFDRLSGERLHFEEFNQLLQKPSSAKYYGSHKDMADFIFTTDGCLATQSYLLYCRILAGILLGNTDMHLKNFAMFHTDSGLRLAPSYDQVCASLYDYKTLALEIAGSQNHKIVNLEARHLCILGEEFRLPHGAIEMVVADLEANKESAIDSISESSVGSEELKDNLINLMRKRWNGTFSSIGKVLSTRQ